MCRTSSPRPQWRATALPNASMSTPSTAYAAAASVEAGLLDGGRLAIVRAGDRLHQLADLLGLVGEVVAQHQPAEVLQHRDEVDDLARRSRPGAAPARAWPASRDPVDRLRAARSRGRRRAGPARRAGCSRPARTPSTPISATTRRKRQHRAVARDLRSLHLRRAERAQQLERERHVGQQMARDLVGALALDRR